MGFLSCRCPGRSRSASSSDDFRAELAGCSTKKRRHPRNGPPVSRLAGRSLSFAERDTASRVEYAQSERGLLRRRRYTVATGRSDHQSMQARVGCKNSAHGGSGEVIERKFDFAAVSIIEYSNLAANNWGFDTWSIAMSASRSASSTTSGGLARLCDHEVTGTLRKYAALGAALDGVSLKPRDLRREPDGLVVVVTATVA